VGGLPPSLFGGSMIERMVYFIQMGENGPIKIGETKSIHERLEMLQVANPYRLRILWVYNGRKYGEAELHEKFKQYNIRGEWFWPVEEILEFRNVHYADCYAATGLELARCWSDMDKINLERHYFDKIDDDDDDEIEE
jgi:hypothetical protein